MHLATTIGYGRMGICAWPPRLNLGIISGCLPNGQAWAGMKHLATDPRSRMLVLEMPDMLGKRQISRLDKWEKICSL
ncbi:hypothetical protein BS78_09G048800 [Paspalum vaginatum]|nr:hypothetical protein BS78_09G048800 [Paspalum vaginatum]